MKNVVSFPDGQERLLSTPDQLHHPQGSVLAQTDDRCADQQKGASGDQIVVDGLQRATRTAEEGIGVI